MDPNQEITQINEEKKLQRDYKVQVVKDTIYRFFYNIWPSVNRVMTFFLYHLMRILKGFFKVALQSITNKQ